MDTPLLDTVVIEPDRPAEAAVIWLHGLGADGNDFVPIVPELGLPEDLAVRFVFPHAPARPVSVNAGMRMPAWFDIHSLDRGAPEDATGLAWARTEVEALMAREVEHGVDAGRLVLAGFSQGGAVALHTALRYPKRLAGIMGLSTWLPLATELAGNAHEANRDTPLFLAHGEQDPMVSPDYGRISAERLRAAGYAPEWHAYPMQHQVCLEEIRDIGIWLARVLRPA